MTVEELNHLIARGAAEPGVTDAMEIMRVGDELNRQAQELNDLYGTAWISAAAITTNVAEDRSTE